MKKKGQLSIPNLLMWFVLVIIGAVFTPIMASFLNNAITSGNYTAGQVIMISAIIIIYWLGMIILLFYYISPRQPQQY